MDRAKQAVASKTQTLVTGGTGKSGRRVVERLAERSVPVRIGSRTATPAFDWENRDTWSPALRGADAAYVIYQPDLAFPGAAETVDAFARLAVSLGVRRLVLLSGRNEEGAQRAEQAVQDSGAEWTIVRASMFNQNFSEHFLLDGIRAGVLHFPAGNVKEPFIDADDIAEIAVAALTEPERHVGQLYEVSGPRLLTFAEAVAEIASASGRTIRYVPVSLEEYELAIVQEGMPAELARQLTELFAVILDGRGEYVSDGVQRALGRPARDFADFARETAATGVWRDRTKGTRG